MRTSTSSYIVELPLRVNDQQNRFLEKAFEFGRALYNAPVSYTHLNYERSKPRFLTRLKSDVPSQQLYGRR